MANALLKWFHRPLTPPVPVNSPPESSSPLRWFYRSVYTRILPDFVRELNAATNGCETILDVGCGARSPIKHFSSKFRRSVGVDFHRPSIEVSKAAGIHSEYRQMNVLDIGKHFRPRSFDCVVSLDVIEHFEKPDALKLIAAMEKIAKKRVVLFTPTGFLPQGEYDENPGQLHKSGWEVEEMQKLGYRIIGINGWKPLRGEYAELRFRPRYLWWVLSDLTQPLVRNLPKHAFQLLCIKNK